MPKLGMLPVRRAALIRATMMVIHEGGLAEPTFAAICERAGLTSPSLINHYFKSKQELLSATMRELANGFVGEVAMKLVSAREPIDRVDAVIAANFAPSQCTPEAVSVWLWFWSRVPLEPAFAEVEKSLDTYLTTELKNVLKAWIPDDEIDDVVNGMLSLMYGLWLRFALDPASINVDSAHRVAKHMIHSQLKAYSIPTEGRTGSE